MDNHEQNKNSIAKQSNQTNQDFIPCYFLFKHKPRGEWEKKFFEQVNQDAPKDENRYTLEEN